MKTNSGIIYALKNVLWGQYLKCGLTSLTLKKRISNLQTSLFIDCIVVETTDKLIDCKIYEFLLKKILIDYRIRNNREFFNVCEDEIKDIFNTFNYMNKILDSEQKLNEYIKKNYPEYFNKKRKYTNNKSSESIINKPKNKKRKGLYVDTRY